MRQEKNMWFENCKTVAEIKKEYRLLVFQYHPDATGTDTNKTMAKINAAYHDALSRCDGQPQRGTDGVDRTYNYNSATEQAIMDKVAETLSRRIISGNVNLDLIGLWLWVTGDTKPVKETLKELGYRWHSKRTCWYWKPYASRTRYNGKASLSDLAAIYGSRSFRNEESDSPIAAR